MLVLGMIFRELRN